MALEDDNLDILEHQVKKYRRMYPMLDPDDVYSQAGLAYVLACRKYDPSYGTTLSAYVDSYVRGYILKHIQQNRMIHIPNRVTNYWNKIQKHLDNGHTKEEILDILHMKEARYDEILRAMSYTTTPIDDDNHPHADLNGRPTDAYN